MPISQSYQQREKNPTVTILPSTPLQVTKQTGSTSSFTLSSDLNMAEGSLRSTARLQHSPNGFAEFDQLVRFLAERAGQNLCIYLHRKGTE